MPVTNGPKATEIYDPATMKTKALDFTEDQKRVTAEGMQNAFNKHGVDLANEPNVGMAAVRESNPRLNPLPVHGYTDQPSSNVDLVNENKIVEEKLLRVVDNLISRYDVDPRWANTARNAFEMGFMALNRAIFKPARISLPTDDPEPSELAPTSPEPQPVVDYNRDTTTDGETGRTD